jgi:hypothetical protein
MPTMTSRRRFQVSESAEVRTHRAMRAVIFLGAIAGASIMSGAALATDSAMEPQPVSVATSTSMAIVLPDTVQKYVRTHRPLSIAFDGEPTVGASRPADARLHAIPGYQFRYVYVNGKPVFVDGQSRRIVHVVQ